MTRVASITLVFDRAGAHEGHYAKYDNGRYVPNFVRFSRHIAFVMKALEQISDGHAGGSPLLGLPINNLLVRFMNCMGLRSADYEKTAGSGYGFYPQARELANFTPDANYWLSTAGKRSPVPNFYRGPLIG